MLCFGFIGFTAFIFAWRFFPGQSQLRQDIATLMPEEILSAINQERQTAHLSPLQSNAALNQAAQAKVTDMFTQQYWAHQAPTGKTAWQFIDATGYQYKLAGENLARDFEAIPDLVASWMASPSHRENILNSQFSQTGLAIAEGQFQGEKTIFIVQLFAEPAAVPLAVNADSAATSRFSLPQAAEQKGSPISWWQKFEKFFSKAKPLQGSRLVFLGVGVVSLLSIGYDLWPRQKKIRFMVEKKVFILLSVAGGLIFAFLWPNL